MTLFEETEAGGYSRVIKFTVSDDGQQCEGRRFIVFYCRTSCGGWGDRLRGISTAFMLALITNRTFLIDMEKPCDIRTILEPNIYDWNKCLSVARAVPSNSTHRLVLYRGMSIKNIDEILTGNLGKYTVIEVSSNQQEYERIKAHKLSGRYLPWIHQLSTADVMGSIYGILFRLSPSLSDALEQFKTDFVRGRQLVCGHVRYGRNPTMPWETRPSNPKSVEILDFLTKFDNMDDIAIYVGTDSEEVRNQSRKMFSNLILTDRRITHIDRMTGPEEMLCDGVFTTVLEHMILSRCDVLVLTRSGFGCTAAYLRGTSTNLFMQIKKTNTIDKVDASDIQDLQKFGLYYDRKEDIANYQRENGLTLTVHTPSFS